MAGNLGKPNYVRKREYLLRLLGTQPNPKGRLIQKWNNLPDAVRTYARAPGMKPKVHSYLAKNLSDKYVVRHGLRISAPPGYRTKDPNSGTNTWPDREEKA